MIAHISLSHLSDPAVTVTGAGLLLLYALWRFVLRPYLQDDVTSTAPEEPSAASQSVQ